MRGNALSARHVLASDRVIVAALSVVAASMLVAYFLNRPQASMYPDSSNYLDGARGLLQGHLFSPVRLPGYPAFLLVFGAVTGFSGGVLVAQGLIYVGAVALTYYVVRRTFAHTWIAALAGLMMATDLFAAAYAKTMLSETLALGIVTGLAATSASFMLHPRARSLWALAALATSAALTRPEWTYFGLAAAAYFGALMIRRSDLRRLAWHGLAALTACYVVIGGYIAGNALTNGFVGSTEITNLSLLGKVMQYHMQDEAPASWASTASLVDEYVTAGKSVWTLVDDHPELAKDHYGVAGGFARAVILRDPFKFAHLSLDIAVARSADFDPQFAPVARGAPLDRPLRGLEFIASARYFVLYLAPMMSMLWLIVPLLRRVGTLATLGPVALIALYGTGITALGGFDEYGRYHVVFLSTMVAIVWGTLGFNIQIAIRRGAENQKLIRLAAIVGTAVLLAGAEVFPFIPHVRLLMELLFGALEAGLLWWTWNRSMFSEPLVGGQLDTAR